MKLSILKLFYLPEASSLPTISSTSSVCDDGLHCLFCMTSEIYVVTQKCNTSLPAPNIIVIIIWVQRGVHWKNVAREKEKGETCMEIEDKIKEIRRDKIKRSEVRVKRLLNLSTSKKMKVNIFGCIFCIHGIFGIYAK